MTLTYEQLLAMIRHHMTDPLIGKGKFGREERLADALLAVIRQDAEGKNARVQLPQSILRMPGDPLTTPVGDEVRSLGSLGSSDSSQAYPTPSSPPPAPVGLSLVDGIVEHLPSWLTRQDRS